MKRFTLAASFLAVLSGVSAQNEIFVPLPYAECNNCLDQAAASCPGDYRDKSVGACMCAGVGSTNTVTCVSVCDGVDELRMGAGEKVVRGWYAYCLLFFPELCAEAQAFTNPEYWEERCGAGSGANTGGDGGSGAGVEAPTGTSGLNPTGVRENSPGVETGTGTRAVGTAAAETGAGTAGGASSRPTSAAGAPVYVPGWGIVFGLGMLGFNM
ncbi:hypothetical protein OQA88_7388 [Cercophora sp. LCS_1]